MIFSSQASYSMKECAAVMGDSPRWLQLYWSKSNELVASFVARAETCGCSAIVLTLDTTMLGWRPRDLDLTYLPFLRGKGIAQYVTDPVFQAQLEEAVRNPPEEDDTSLTPAALKAFAQMVRNYPGHWWQNLGSGKPRVAVQTFITTYSRPSLTWADLSYRRDLTSLPILLKGILHPDDAGRAVDQGMDGIIVSNHGGRQVDGAVGACDVLPAVVAAVDDQIPVLFDSGIRGGADVFKALALGATAVCLGRPYAYGLAVAGEQGVREVIQNILADFDLTMGLAGCTAVSEITPTNLARSDELPLQEQK
jgi:lactate 2-monooxygenase